VIGQTIAHYRITAKLGAGGMGEVYRAVDTKLDREVAIKILPDSVTHDPERLARLEREAKVLASLNHPNIAQIYTVEQGALVLELVKGETLKGPLPLDTALIYASQIADALAVAHDKGIVHRDLKPANIMITPAGVVKVLDFGLAKAVDESTGDPQNSPTLTISPTRAGVILGTAPYMSPEQARGKPVDKRADIWAFGCVLYEMLIGEPAFTGETTTDVLAAVVKTEPDLAKVPFKLRRLVRHCLEKNPNQRMQAIGDWPLLVEDRPLVERPRGPVVLWLEAAVLAVLCVATTWVAWRAARPTNTTLRPVLRLDVDLGPDVSISAPFNAPFALSPDGRSLAYVSRSRIFVRQLDQSQATELPDTSGGYAPFFSPDNRSLAFFGQGRLKRISLEGGAPMALCEACQGVGGSWSEDGNIFITQIGAGQSLLRVPSAGGAATPITEVAPGEASHRWPQALPGGKAVLFTASTTLNSFDAATIDVISLADHNRKTLVKGGTFGRYLPTGHLVYVNQGTLYAVRFDLKRLNVLGAPVPVLDQVDYSSALGSADIDFSESGTLVYRRGGTGRGRMTVQWLYENGQVKPLLANPGYYLRPRLSPDGSRLAMDLTDGAHQDIWIHDLNLGAVNRLTYEGANQNAVWTPNGRYLVLKGKDGIDWIRANGTGKPEPLTQSKSAQFPYSFSPDGRRLAYHEVSERSGFDIWTLPIESDEKGLRGGKPAPFLQTPFDERSPAFSPDGRWIAYVSNESGPYQVYVRGFPDTGGKWQVSVDGGSIPEWSRTERKLFFRTEDQRIMVASYSVKGGSFVPEKPRVWSEQRIGGGATFGNYDLAPEGKRIAALVPFGQQADQPRNQVTLLLNFYDELRRRVPVGR
jgi:serine/threonine-protein kinase